MHRWLIESDRMLQASRTEFGLHFCLHFQQQPEIKATELTSVHRIKQDKTSSRALAIAGVITVTNEINSYHNLLSVDLVSMIHQYNNSKQYDTFSSFSNIGFM